MEADAMVSTFDSRVIQSCYKAVFANRIVEIDIIGYRLCQGVLFKDVYGVHKYRKECLLIRFVLLLRVYLQTATHYTRHGMIHE